MISYERSISSTWQTGASYLRADFDVPLSAAAGVPVGVSDDARIAAALTTIQEAPLEA
ncbi:MAG: hypothetical protein JOY58_12585 [Solirubrobacterales bacterium]|nr:hypothetical protein [Solirubrobacterales bacterium]MBV9049104.1 hypothetical protein [Solirubrobacterales bacterium]